MTSHWQQTQTLSRPLPAPEALIHQIITGHSAPMMRLKKLIATVAVSDAPVMVQGPTGAGKELVAQAVHRASSRHGALIAVNCAAIPSELLESELFGHEKGAFTGADRQHIGLIEQAHGGTLFLDEIGDMPERLQSKLLRVLETGKVLRLGAMVEQSVDFRLITATHRDLDARVADGSFRADLYFRIAVFPIVLPALSERTEDIPLILARMISDRLAENPALDAPHFDPSALRVLAAYTWPGNVRELRNVLSRAFVLFPGGLIGAAQVRDNLLTLRLPDTFAREDAAASSGAAPDVQHFHQALSQPGGLDSRGYLRDVEVGMIEAALDLHGGCVSRAADALRLRRTTLIEKIKKYAIRRAAI